MQNIHVKMGISTFKFQLHLIKLYFQFWNFDSPTYLPTSQHHALSAQAAWVRILQTVRSWAATSASSIDHPNHLIILEYWSLRCKNNWLELCMRNEQFKAFCGISFHTRCHLGSSCPYLILIHSKTKKSHKTQSKCQFFQKNHIQIVIICSKQS